MKRVFGLPVGPLSFWLVVVMAVSLGAVTILAVRNLVFVKIGLRNVPRRRARSALIVVGLMLGTTIIASALLTGDTMAAAVRSSVVRQLGVTDELVTAGTDAQTAVDIGLQAARPYFDARSAVAAVDQPSASLPVDGVLAAIVEPVAAQHTAAGRTAPDVTLFAPDPGRAGLFGFADVTSLTGDRVLLNDKAAVELEAKAGDTIGLFVGGRRVEAEVAAVGRYDGAGTDGSAVIVPLAAAQQVLARAGQVNSVLVSNSGGPTAGAAATASVEPALDEALAALGLEAQPVKRDGLDAADTSGNAFVQLFTTFGSFSMAAGILLIFLIFVMLAAERRPEMGMARAVGTQRRHLVQMFLYEGVVYDLVAAAVGAVLGIGVSFVMVRAVARTFEGDTELHLSYSLSLRSLLIAYSIGVLLTLAVVTVSAWRVSRLNIVSAVRDLPESRLAGIHRRRLVVSFVVVAGGVLLAVSGASASAYLPWMLGLSIAVLGAVPLARRAGVPDRLAHTAAGGLLVVAWLLPFSVFDRLFGDMSMDFTVWVVGGLIVVIAATWLIIYNADLLLGAAGRLASPFAAARPVARMAVAYPLRDRFRTGVVMAMFMLVVFTLVTGSTIPRAFTQSFDDVHRFGGGFDIQVTTASAAAVDDLRSVLPADVAADVSAAGAQSFVPLAARQVDGTSTPEAYPVRGVDDGFLQRTTYDLAAMADGYTTKQQVWAALATHPGLAVVDPFVVPRRNHWGFAVLPAFQLHGFYVEDGRFRPVPVEAVDPLTGTTLHLTVIGVLADRRAILDERDHRQPADAGAVRRSGPPNGPPPRRGHGHRSRSRRPAHRGGPARPRRGGQDVPGDPPRRGGLEHAVLAADPGLHGARLDRRCRRPRRHHRPRRRRTPPADRRPAGDRLPPRGDPTLPADRDLDHHPHRHRRRHRARARPVLQRDRRCRHPTRLREHQVHRPVAPAGPDLRGGHRRLGRHHARRIAPSDTHLPSRRAPLPVGHVRGRRGLGQGARSLDAPPGVQTRVGPCLVRRSGNDERLAELASRNALAV